MTHQKPSGVLNPPGEGQRIRLEHFEPAASLADIIERYWSVRWSFDDEHTQRQQTVPHPCVNLAFESDQAHVVGIFQSRFERTLEGQGRVFGVKFKPGAFHAVSDASTASLFGAIVPAASLLPEVDGLLEQMLRAPDDAHRCQVCDVYLDHIRSPTDTQYQEVQQAIELIISRDDLFTVRALARYMATTPRSLQRLFKNYVGVSPKWVICRYRIQAAIDALSLGRHHDNWSVLSLKLGYYDQSHFINDFKALVGQTPQQYSAGL